MLARLPSSGSCSSLFHARSSIDILCFRFEKRICFGCKQGPSLLHTPSPSGWNATVHSHKYQYLRGVVMDALHQRQHTHTHTHNAAIFESIQDPPKPNPQHMYFHHLTACGYGKQIKSASCEAHPTSYTQGFHIDNTTIENLAETNLTSTSTPQMIIRRACNTRQIRPPPFSESVPQVTLSRLKHPVLCVNSASLTTGKNMVTPVSSRNTVGVSERLTTWTPEGGTWLVRGVRKPFIFFSSHQVDNKLDEHVPTHKKSPFLKWTSKSLQTCTIVCTATNKYGQEDSELEATMPAACCNHHRH